MRADRLLLDTHAYLRWRLDSHRLHARHRGPTPGPDTGEVHCRYLFGLLDRLGCEGWAGAEYVPRAAAS